MKLISLLFAAVLATGALAGCADNGPATTTPTPTTTTPVTTPTPTTTTPVVTPPTNETPPPECTPKPPAADAVGTRIGLPELQFTVQEPSESDPCYRFAGPATATAGWTVVSLDHPTGMEFHIMPMIYIGNHTVPEAMAALGAGEEPSWAVAAGGVGGVTPHSSGAVAMDLEPGTYVYFCPINGHHMQGMSGALVVTPSADTNATRPEPTTNVTVTLQDYSFDLPENISASTTLVKIVNNGTEDHEAPLVKLNAGTNMTMFLGALEDPNATAPPPGALIGGSNVLAPGGTIYWLVNLEAGTRYGSVCFVESASHGGAPHIALGMVAEFAAV